MRVLDNNLVLKLDNLNIGLDTAGGDIAFMSHAHTDHIIRKAKCPIIASKLTAELATHRTGEKYNLINEHPFLKLIDSGHVIGSKALLINNNNEKILYTGDFTTRDRFFLKGLKPVKCDTLIIESTYGIPEYDLPKPDDVIREARDVILDDLARGYNPCLIGYALGKAQLITKIAEGLGEVYANERIRGINTLCNKHGFNIPVPDLLSKEARNFIYITPNINDCNKIPNKRTYSFTGWAQGRTLSFAQNHARTTNDSAWNGECINGFALSDHAGFTDLLRFVKACNPEKVLTHHGFAKEFAQFLREEGYQASALN